MTHRLRRNDIVRQKKDGWFYGRVWKRVDDDHVVVICCGKHITTYRDDELEVHNDYKGKWSQSFDGQVRDRYPVFYRMPTLRKLKQRASGYHYDKVWRKPKPNPYDLAHRETMKTAVWAPFSDRQIELIHLGITDGPWSAPSCENKRSDDSSEWEAAHEAHRDKHGHRWPGQLEVRREGLYCPVCDYTVDWVCKEMLLGDFRKDR